MSQTVTADVYLIVDDCGDYAVGNSPEAAREKYEECVQPLADCGGFLLVKLAVEGPLPEVVELAIDVPADATAATLSVA